MFDWLPDYVQAQLDVIITGAYLLIGFLAAGSVVTVVDGICRAIWWVVRGERRPL